MQEPIIKFPLEQVKSFFGAMEGFLLAFYLSSFFFKSGLTSYWAFLIGIPTLIVLGVIRRMRKHKMETHHQWFCLYPDKLVFPKKAGSTKEAVVALTEMKSIGMTQNKRSHKFLLIETGDKVYAPHLQDSFSEQDWLHLQQQLENCLMNLPGGTEVIQQFEQRSVLQSRIFSQESKATKFVGLFLLIYQAIIYQKFGWSSPIDLLNSGASFFPLIQEGQWTRIFSANLIHFGMLHFFLNVMAIYSLGTILEKVLGPFRFLCMLLLSFVLGAMVPMWFYPHHLQVGSSTGVFGVFGSLLFLNLKYARTLPLGVKQPIWIWVINLGVNIALPFIVPAINWVAHLVGFVVGMGTTALMLKPFAHVEHIIGTRPKYARVLASLLILPFLYSASVSFFKSPYEKDLDLAAYLKSRFQKIEKKELINELAYQLASYPYTSRAANSISLQFMEKIKGTNPYYLDTYALILWRLGNFQEAIETQRQVIELSRPPQYGEKLFKFAMAMETKYLFRRPDKLDAKKLGIEFQYNPNGLFVENHNLKPGYYHFAIVAGDMVVGLAICTLAGETHIPVYQFQGPSIPRVFNGQELRFELIEYKPLKKAINHIYYDWFGRDALEVIL